jgi:hypothetical protein
MKQDVDIVIQGGLWDNTYESALSYIDLDFVNDVIISTWTNELDKIQKYPDHQNIKWALSPWPDPFEHNMNLQLISSRAGIALSRSPIVVKTRSDQKIFPNSMNMLNRFFNKFSENLEIEYENGLGPIAPIFTIGMLSTFPYHPHDQLLWGYREDMVDLFDLPLALSDEKIWRGEIWLGGHYYARFNSKVYEHLDDSETYLVDESPKFSEAMALYNTMRDKVFKPFPRFDMYWIKYKSGFWYHEYEPQGAYYYDYPWE